MTEENNGWSELGRPGEEPGAYDDDVYWGPEFIGIVNPDTGQVTILNRLHRNPAWREAIEAVRELPRLDEDGQDG